MDRTTVLVPLSSVDQAGFEACLSVLSYVVSAKDGLDVDAIHQACVRLVERWRLLAGVVVWVPEKSTFAVRVTLGPIAAHERLHFTNAGERGALGIESKMGSKTEAKTVKTLPMKYFVHKDTQGSLAALAKSGMPILNVHISRWDDYTCIGIAVPHGIFDGTGHGFVTQFLDAELHGREYTPPPLNTPNIIQPFFDDAANTPESGAPSDKHIVMLSNLKRELVQSGFRSISTILCRLWYEYLWHGAEDRALYLGSDVVERIVSKVKADVKKVDPNAWVSTGDILFMWTVQTAYADETPDPNHAVSIMSAVSLRSVFAEHNKDFATFPHNCFLPCVFPLMDKAQTKASSLAELAMFHRRGITAVRNLSYFQSWARHVKAVGSSIADRRWKHDSWLSTNQILTKGTELAFPGANGAPSSIVAFFYHFTPFVPDHAMFINQLNGGYILQGPLRQSRWRSIDRALAELSQ